MNQYNFQNYFWVVILSSPLAWTKKNWASSLKNSSPASQNVPISKRNCEKRRETLEVIWPFLQNRSNDFSNCLYLSSLLLITLGKPHVRKYSLSWYLLITRCLDFQKVVWGVIQNHLAEKSDQNLNVMSVGGNQMIGRKPIQITLQLKIWMLLIF